MTLISLFIEFATANLNQKPVDSKYEKMSVKRLWIDKIIKVFKTSFLKEVMIYILIR